VTSVAVLTGGSTPERDVALAGAGQVVAALRSRDYDVTVVDTVGGVMSAAEEKRRLVAVGKTPPTLGELAALAERELGAELTELEPIAGADVVFIVLHGLQGEGGEVQGLLQAAGLTYAGSDPLSSALAMDKNEAKRLFRDAGIPTAAWKMWPVSDAEIAALGLPLVVKPSRVGSSVGLTVVRGVAELSAAVEEARAYDDDVMLEAYASGAEYTVGILGDEALAVGEIIPSHEIFDYECKYTPGMTQEIFPADIPQALSDELRRIGLASHRTLGLRDFSRVDFRFGADGIPYVLEANTLPGLTATSLLPQSAAAVGIPFEDLCDRICRLALARRETGTKPAAEA
jgi:D-alanine-D-alanine ligase